MIIEFNDKYRKAIRDYMEININNNIWGKNLYKTIHNDAHCHGRVCLLDPVWFSVMRHFVLAIGGRIRRL